MNTNKYQAFAAPKLYQPGVDRRVVRLVARGDTDHLVPGTHVTMDELHEYQLLGRRLQARAVASAFAGLFRAVVWPFRRFAAAYARAGRESAAIRQLSALDDYLLADIGVQRGQIPAAVKGLLDRSADETRQRTAELLRHERPVASNDPHSKAAA